MENDEFFAVRCTWFTCDTWHEKIFRRRELFFLLPGLLLKSLTDADGCLKVWPCRVPAAQCYG